MSIKHLTIIRDQAQVEQFSTVPDALQSLDGVGGCEGEVGHDIYLGNLLGQGLRNLECCNQ